MSYKGKRALVTGGLGFIGSNLAIRLAAEGARVTVVDSSIPGCGANPFNLAPVAAEIKVVARDIAEAERLKDHIASADVIFNLAGEISHVHSMQFPERDMQINAVAQMQFLDACKSCARGVRIVYAGTRQVFGAPRYLPVDEEHPIQPVDFNGIHKYAATAYHMLYTQSGDLDALVLRLTNVYGPRMALDVPCQGFLSTFFRRVLLGQDVEVFGTGSQLRDPIFVDDAVDAFLLAGAVEKPRSRLYNVGGPGALSLAEIARMIVDTAGGDSKFLLTPFPPERKAIDIGSYTTDSSRIRAELGWKPRTSFRDGLALTLDYYRAQLRHYLDPDNPFPECRMPEHKGTVGRLTYTPVW